MERLLIKRWFKKKLSEDVRYANAFRRGNLENYTVEKESEKAYLFNCEFMTDSESFFNVKIWVPKSCTEIYNDKDEEGGLTFFAELHRDAEEDEKAMQKGLEKYMRLYNFAIEKGLKIRKRTKTENILKALSEAGITYSEA